MNQEGRGTPQVEIEHAEVRAPSARILRSLVLTFFLGLLSATAIVDRIRPLPLPSLVGAEKAEEERLREEARFLDGSLMKLIERDLQLTSRVRRLASADYRLALYRTFGEASGEQVVVGQGGWIFVENRALPPPGRADRILERWATRLVAMQRGLADRGVRVAYLPLPRRAAIEAERLPRGFDARVDIDRSAAGVLQQHGLEAVDLYPVFAAHEGPPLFYRADAHWNENGERLAAEETMRQLGLLLPPNQREGRIEQTRFEPQGTREDMNFDLLLLLVGIEDPGGSGALRGDDVPLYDVIHPQGFKRGGHKQPKRMRELALTGTSFSARRHFALYLEHFSKQRIWNGSYMASGPIAPVRELVLRSQEELPKLILAEVPIYTAFQGAQMTKQISRFLREQPPLSATPLKPVALELDPASSDLELRVEEEWMPVLKTQQGALLSTWDHLIGMRVRGEVLEGEIQWSVLDASASFNPVWAQGSHDDFLPLIAPRHASRPVILRVRSRGGPAKLRLDGVEFVTTLRRAEGVALDSLREGAQNGSWFSEFRLAPADEDRALLIGPWSGDLPPNGALRIEVAPLAGGGEPRELLAGRMVEGGWIVCSLGNSGRTAETRVRFSGLGDRLVPKMRPQVVPVGAPKRE